MLFSINGYHPFKSVDNDRLLGLMQACVDVGAKYGKFDIQDVVVGRKTVSTEIASTAKMVTKQLKSLNERRFLSLLKRSHDVLTSTLMTIENSLTLMCPATGLNVTLPVTTQLSPCVILDQQHILHRTSTRLLAVFLTNRKYRLTTRHSLQIMD